MWVHSAVTAFETKADDLHTVGNSISFFEEYQVLTVLHL